MRQIRPNQDGLVSLTATIIISLLLSVIVISMVAIMVVLQHQATDNADSIRAYYAAEAGIEDGILQIEDAVDNGSSPGQPPLNVCNSITLSGGAAVTCQQFSTQSNAVTGVLTKDGTAQEIDLPGLGIKSIKISWNVPAEGDSTSCNSAPCAFPANFPNSGGSWQYPAVMELTTVGYNSTGPLGQPVELVTQPASAGGSPYNYNYAPASQPGTATCAPPTAASPYTCFVIVHGYAPNSDYLLRLKARYAGTHFQVQAYSTPTATGAPIQIPDEFETIDSTAKVGDAYRRISERFPIVSSAANIDYVLFADDQICKNYSYSVTFVPNLQTGCPPNF